MATIKPCSCLRLPSLISSSPSPPLYPCVSFTLRRGGPFGFPKSNTAAVPLLLRPHSTAPRPRTSISPASASSVPDATIPIPEQDTATATIISVLLFIAFVGLSILTIGVIYIAVTDFLQKREREKFQKEEAEKKKKGGGKKRQTMEARAGPKGFGQKIVEIEEDDDI